MLRFIDGRTWNILREVPANYSRLVMETLSLRQKIVLSRQGTHFLKRCLQHRVIPRFIKSKELHKLCGRTREDRQIREIELHILKVAIRSKQDHVYRLLNKCASMCCQRFLPSPLWRRIVGESRGFCDLIRSRIKVKLQRKFQELVNGTGNDGVDTSSNQLAYISSRGHGGGEDAESPQRVTVLGDVSLSSEALSALKMGPSFAPSQCLSHAVVRKIVGSLQKVRDQLRCRARIDEGGRQPVLESSVSVPPVPFPSSFVTVQQPNWATDNKFRILATSLLTVLQRNITKRSRPNLSAEQRRV